MPRYFLMRCAEGRIVERAVSKGLWPVSHGCLGRLNDAFASGEDIVLLFTVTGSGAFQGCAKMKSTASQTEGQGPQASCRIAMMHWGDLPYADAEHLINPLSEPPGPVRAGKDGTEVEPAVAEELVGLLAKAAANPKPAAPAAASPKRTGTAAAGVRPAAAAAGGMPGMVGAGLMGMPDPYLMGVGGVNPMLAAMNPLLAMNPMLALNPMAAAMMLGGMSGMMAAGMRPGALGPLGASAAAAAAASGPAAASGKGAVEGGKGDPKSEPGADDRERREGPPGGRYSGPRYDKDHEPRVDRERYERMRERERYEGGRGGPRGGPPPFGRDGPPPFMFRDAPRGPPDFRDGPPPGYDRRGRGGPGPYDREGPWGREFRGPPRDFGPPGFFGPRDQDVSPPLGRGPPPREWERDAWERERGWEREDWERERERGGSRERENGRPDLLRMSYDEYVAKFRQLKELQAGGSDKQLVVAGGSSDIKHNAAAAAEGSAGAGAASGDGAGSVNVQMMSEEEYVTHCERFSAQMHMPFNADMVRQAYRALKASIGSGGR